MRRAAVIVIVMMLASAGFAQDGTWLPRYDEQSSGVSPASLELPVSLAWKHTIDDNEARSIATPAVGEDMIYAPVGSSVYAIDRVTGALVWERATGDAIYSSPVLADGVLYFGSRDGNLWAVDAEDGSVEWRYPAGAAVDCSPVLAYGVLYFGSDANRVVALDLETRQPIWQFETGGDIKASPLVYRDVVVVGSLDNRIYCLNNQGRPIWSEALAHKAFFASPVGERTKVIYASGRNLMARDIYTGRLVWPRPFRAADLIVGAPAVQGRRVYVGTRGGAVYCIDANRGRAIWRYPAEGNLEPISSAVSIVDDVVVFKSGDRTLMAVSLDGQQLRWKYVLPEVPQEVAQPGAGPGMGPGMEPGMGPGMMEPGMEPGMMEPGMMEPGGPGMEPGTGRTGEPQEVVFEETVNAAVAVTENALYTTGADNVVYGFEFQAPDNIEPTIADAVLEVPGKGRTRVEFAPEIADEDDFPDRYASDIQIPGTPPIYLSLQLTDEGSGVDPESVSVTINGERADFTYDAIEGLVWYIYAPRGAAANLSNGVKVIEFSATDWRGNTARRYVSMTIDNRLNPPELPRQQRQQFEPGMGPGMEPGMEMPPEMMAPMVP